MVTLIAGAHLANACGLTTFNVDAMQRHLITTLLGLRDDTLEKQAYVRTGPDAGEEALEEMKSDIKAKHMLVTKTIWTGVGKPVQQVQAGTGFVDPVRRDDVWMQTTEDGSHIVARLKPFNKWLVEHGHKVKPIIDKLRRDYRIDVVKRTIGAGMPEFSVMGRSTCYEMVKLKKVSHTPSSPSSSSGSPAPTTPAS